MKNLTDMALTLATEAGADFADVRIQERRQNTVVVSRRTLKAVNDSENFGFSVRVLKNGNWGFASDTRLTADTVIAATRQALATADASAIAPKDYEVRFCAAEGIEETCVGPCLEAGQPHETEAKTPRPSLDNFHPGQR